MNAAEVYPPVLHTLEVLQQLVNINRPFWGWGRGGGVPAHHVASGRGQRAPTGTHSVEVLGEITRSRCQDTFGGRAQGGTQNRSNWRVLG